MEYPALPRLKSVNLGKVKVLLDTLALNLCVPFNVEHACFESQLTQPQEIESLLGEISAKEKQLNQVVGIAKILLEHNQELERERSSLKNKSPDINFEESKIIGQEKTKGEVLRRLEMLDKSEQTLFPEKRYNEDGNTLIGKEDREVQTDINDNWSSNLINNFIIDQSDERQEKYDQLYEENSNLKKLLDNEKKNSELLKEKIKLRDKELENFKIQAAEVAKYSYEIQPCSTIKSTSSRCLATTLKGTRCKRNTRDASGYCWQH